MIVILNGPPGVGKDTIADAFVRLNKNFTKDSFKSVLYTATADYFDLSVEQLIQRNNNRELKDVPYYLFEGYLKSVRELLIYVSEEIIKPKLGKDYFGRVKGSQFRYHKDKNTNFILSDGGFIEETNAVCNEVGAENVIIIRLYRDSYYFNNGVIKDSRSYINPKESKCKVIDIHLKEDDIGKAYCDIRKQLIENYFK